MHAKVGTLVMQGEVHQDVPDGSTAVAIPQDGGQISSLMQMAVQRMDGANATAMVEAMKGMYDLYREELRRKAEVAFYAAMAQFQQECPPIPKTSKTKTDGGSGAKFAYTFAELDQIAKIVNPILSRHGLSYSWDSEVANAQIKAVCHLRHAEGHSITATFSCPATSNLPVSDQQKYASALTYARRYSLVQVLGLTTTDEDNDGGATQHMASATIKAGQADEIEDLLSDTQTDRAEWLKYYGIESVMDLPVSKFERAKKQLERKKAV